LFVDDLDIPAEAKNAIANFGVTELYPPQEEAVKAGALEGKNLVLASPTASGKTFVAELCALKHILERDGKVLYLTPLKALASEKYKEFKKYGVIKKADGRAVSVGISTGDFDSSDPRMGKFDIIVTTNEKCDSLLRHRARWMDSLSLVVADEVHLINDVDRGPTLEVVLARLMQVNPHIQVLALSATVRNVDEIAEWLKAAPVTTDWRPVVLREGVFLDGEIQFKDGGTVSVKGKAGDSSINLALHSVEQGGQSLIFASTRKNSVSLAKKAAPKVSGVLSKSLSRSLSHVAENIAGAGERTRISEMLADLVRHGVAFHHAGLPSAHRNLIEDAFRDGLIKVLTATPTLAFGVNLPARTVVVSDYRRYESGYGFYPIPVLEYKQLAGRAGRPKYDKTGESILIAKTEEERDYLFSSYILAKPERIWSKLGVEKVLRGHVLAPIAAEFAYSEQGVYDFFNKTLYAFQYGAGTIKGIIAKILKFLYDEGMIEVDGPNLRATAFGRRVSQLYIDPLSAIIIRDGLQSRAPKMTNLSILQMVTHTPDMFPVMRPSTGEVDKLMLFVEEHSGEFMFEKPDEWGDRVAYEQFLGEVKTALVLRAWMDETSEEEMIETFNAEPGDLYRLIETARWLLYSSDELARLLGHKDLLPHITELQERVKKGIKAELLPLTRLEGIGRVRARIMFNAGLKSVEDLQRVPLRRLAELVGPTVAKNVKGQVGGMVKLKEWKSITEEKQSEQQDLTGYYK
jgi:helicase